MALASTDTLEAILNAFNDHDLDAIMALETSVFVGDAWSPDLMRGELTSPHSYYLVAEREGAVVGYSGLRYVSGATDADIQTIAVAPSARRLGLGRSLMHDMIDEAARRGARTVFLEVRDDNPQAQSLYTSLGFVPVERYNQNPVDGLAFFARRLK